MRQVVKSYVSAKVIQKEDEMLDLISELDGGDIPKYIHRRAGENDAIAYKELNNDKLSKLFNDFQLLFIHNSMEQNGFIGFCVCSHAGLLMNEIYSYGFYYSNDNEPRDIASGNKCDLEFTEDEEWTSRWYRTEKIKDNWWYYEYKFVLKK